MNTRIATAALAASLLAACSSGGSVSPTPVVIPPAPPGTTTTSFVISLNGGGGETVATGGARPAFVSPSARSISYAVDGGAASTQNLTATSTNCTASSGGVRCTVPLANLAAGTHALALTTWDATNGTGNKLGANANIGFTVVANQANLVSGIIGGIATGVDLVPIGPGARGDMTQGFTIDWSSKPVTFVANPLDAAGNAIVGPGAPVVSIIPGTADMTTAAGSAPNSFVVTATNPNNCGPSACGYRGDTLRLTVTPSAGSGGTELDVTVPIIPVTTFVYIVNANGQVQAFDDSGSPLAVPNASDAINTTGGVLAVAFDPASTSLLAVQGTSVITYGYEGNNLANQLGQGTAALGTAFVWDAPAGAAFGWDTAGWSMVRLDTGADPTTVTPIGPTYVHDPSNAYIAYAAGSGNSVYDNFGSIYAANTGAVYDLPPSGIPTGSGAFGAIDVGTINGLAYDLDSTNLWVSGSNGIAYYPQAAPNVPATSIADANGPTGVATDPFNDLVYVPDATGHVRVFDQHGVPQFSFATAAGTHPVQILIAP